MPQSAPIPESFIERIKDAAVRDGEMLDDMLVEFFRWARASSDVSHQPPSWDQLSQNALVSPKQVSERLLLSQSKLAKLRCSGKGPRYVKLGSRTVAYRVKDVDAYIHANLQCSTSEA